MSVSAERPEAIDYDRTAGRATLIFADDAAVRARLADAVAVAGGRIAEHGTIAAAPATIAARTGTVAIVVALAHDGGAALDALLDEIDAAARQSRGDALVIAPSALLDLVGARPGGAGVTVLIDPDDGEIAHALGDLVAWRGAGVAEPGGDERRRLAELSEETARIARALAGLSEGRSGYRAPGAADPGVVSAMLLAAVRALIRTRRMRAQYFDATLFADPAWDMLLDLFAARLEDRRVAVSSLCIAAAVPPTTALRWIATMTREGLIERRPDPADGRRMFLALSDRAADAMVGYLAATLRHLAPTET